MLVLKFANCEYYVVQE